jgi:hypothetical protein
MMLPEGVRGQILACAMCLVPLAVIDLVVVQPLLGAYETRAAAVEQREAAADHLRETLSDLPGLRMTVEAWRKKTGSQDLLVSGTTDDVAAAAVQSEVKDLLAENGAVLNSAEVVPSQPDEQFRAVGIHAAFSGDLPKVTAVLRGIEAAHPALFIDNLDIHRGADAGDSETPDLSVAFDVYGYRSP